MHTIPPIAAAWNQFTPYLDESPGTPDAVTRISPTSYRFGFIGIVGLSRLVFEYAAHPMLSLEGDRQCPNFDLPEPYPVP